MTLTKEQAVALFYLTGIGDCDILLELHKELGEFCKKIGIDKKDVFTKRIKYHTFLNVNKIVEKLKLEEKL